MRNQTTHQGVVIADRRAVEARRAAAEGRRPKRVSDAPTVEWEWITEHDKVVEACLKMIKGEPGVYPVFGIQLYVEMRKGNDQDFPVLVFHDALYGNDGQNLCGNLREGFYITPSHLSWDINSKTVFKTPYHELLILTLLAQPEMQEARQLYFKEKEDAQHQREEIRKNLLGDLRSRVIGGNVPFQSSSVSVTTQGNKKKGNKIDYVEFKSLEEIFGDTPGIFNFDSGGILKLCPVAGGKFVVRIQKVSDDHPMYEVYRRNICVFPRHIRINEADTPDSELELNKTLERKARVWLREQFKIAGITLNTQGVAGESEEDQGNALRVEDSVVG